MILGIVLEYKRHYTVIHMKGELMAGNLKILEEVLYDQFNRQARTLALDMSDLEYIEPKTARKLIEYKHDAELRKITLSIICINASNRKTLKDYGVDVAYEITTPQLLEDEYSGRKKFSLPGIGMQFNVKL